MKARQLARFAGRDVYLLTGQSNGAAFGALRSAWPQCEGYDAGILFANDLCNYGNPITLDEMSPAMSGSWDPVGGFATALGVAARNVGQSPAVFVAAWGGASAEQCQTNLIGSGIPFWIARIAELSEIRSVTLAIHQGEDETLTGNPWRAVWEESIALIRAGLSLPNLRVGVVQIPTAYVPDTYMATLIHIDDVRAEQAALVAADANAFQIDPGIATTVDGIHHDYTTATRIARGFVAAAYP